MTTDSSGLRRFTRGVAGVLGVGLAFGMAPVSAHAAIDIFDADPHLPAGLTNLAEGKTPASSESYEQGQWGWSLSFLNDGRIGTPGENAWGWSTIPAPGVATQDTPAWVQLDLVQPSTIERVALWPRMDGEAGANFPVDVSVQVSDDALTWSTAATSTGNTTVTSAKVVDFDRSTDATSAC